MLMPYNSDRTPGHAPLSLPAVQMEHKDFLGNHGVIGPGGVQWMTAGRGEEGVDGCSEASIGVAATCLAPATAQKNALVL
jgi:hypothetical protein